MYCYHSPSRLLQLMLLVLTFTLLAISLLAIHNARKANHSVVDHYTGMFTVSESSPSEARKISAQELMSRPLATDRTKAPRLLHQSWKDSALPAKFQEWSESCRKAHPDWEYVMWTDEDNMNMVEKYAPWFVNSYDGLKSEIYRADAARNLYMYIFGGVYADLDTECLRSYDSMFEDHNITTAPHNQPTYTPRFIPDTIPTRKAFVGRRGKNKNTHSSIPNAWMASTPGHPFWVLPLDYIVEHAADEVMPELLTGPDALYATVKNYQKKYDKENHMKLDEYYAQSAWGRSEASSLARSVESPPLQTLEILPDWEIFPYSWDREELRRVCLASDPRFDAASCKDVLDVDGLGSYSITYWSHTWHAEDGHEQKMLEAMEKGTKKPWRGIQEHRRKIEDMQLG